MSKEIPKPPAPPAWLNKVLLRQQELQNESKSSTLTSNSNTFNRNPPSIRNLPFSMVSNENNGEAQDSLHANPTPLSKSSLPLFTNESNINKRIITKTESIDLAISESSDDEMDQLSLCTSSRSFLDLISPSKCSCNCSGILDETPKESNNAQSRKDRAYARTNIDNLQIMMKCNAECPFDRKCLADITNEQTCAFVTRFWGRRDQIAPDAKEREQRIIKIFDELAVKHLDSKRFTFRIAYGREICEAAFVNLIGLLHSPNASDAPYQWKEEKLFRLSGSTTRDKEINKAIRKNDKTVSNSAKRDDAYNFIKHLTSVLVSDTMPTKEGVSNGNADAFVRVLPYESVEEIYREYLDDHAVYIHQRQCRPASRALFFSIFKQMVANKICRLMGCKGSFPTCAICNALTKMIRENARKYTAEQREMVGMFKKLHLKHQEYERRYKAEVKDRCRREHEFNGQPKEAFIYCDAATATLGNIPNYGPGRKVNRNNFIENRLFGIEIISGPIEFTMFVLSDNTIPGGANTTIDVLRIAQDELSIALEEHGFEMPKKINYQFDNGGENKNKEVFTYASLILELDVVHQIEINFLIVGHTHDSLDQEFSVVSNALEACNYIASPLGLHEVFKNCHKSNPEFNPRCIRKLEFIYDWKSFFAPVINKKIKWFLIPHRFRLKKVGMVACVEYMHYSPFEGESEDWWPKQPLNLNQNLIHKDRIDELQIAPFATVNGEERFMEYLNISSSTKTAFKDGNALKQMTNFQVIRDDLSKLEHSTLSKITAAQFIQSEIGDNGTMSNEDRESFIATETANRKSLQIAMSKEETMARGFVFFLDMVTRVGSDAIYHKRPNFYCDLGKLNPNISFHVMF